MISGILNIKKEAGFTSHDVVAKLRRIVGQKKIGHTGTLDPDATGVLPVCLGKATKLCDIIGDWDKTYEAVLLLGKETDTEDTSGKILEEKEVTVTEEEIQNIILSFQGTYDHQIPPMYSAKKVNGKKLYELARQGIVIERKPCPVTLSSIHIKKIELPYVTFEVTCSKGTYIRSLCRDIGVKAGCGGCMAGLIRTRVSSFRIEEGFTLSEVEEMRDRDTLSEHIIPVDKVFLHLPAVFVKEKGEKLLYNGNPIAVDLYEKEPSAERQNANEKQEYIYTVGDRVRVYDSHHNFIGIYQLQENQVLKPYKLFL